MDSIASDSFALGPAVIPSITPAIQSVPLLDLDRQHRPLRKAMLAAMTRVYDSGRFVLGPDCDELEKSLAKVCKVPHAIGCASGSDALLLALMACDVDHGDEVILPSYTFFATAGAVSRLGAKPVFVDIEPTSYNMDPALIEKLITPRTKAIIPVHLYGQCAEMDQICRIAAKHRLYVIEDAAQAIGAEYHGRPAGSIGDIGCLSFYPTKNLGGSGDGGMMTACRDDLAAKLRLLRVHGMEPRYYHKLVGINSRLDSLQAAMLNVKTPHLARWTQQRTTNAQRYTDLFTQYGLHNVLGLPQTAEGCKHVWNQYIVRVPDSKRDALRKHLADARVGTEIYYPVPLHLQECFQPLGYKPGSLPESERAAAETLALPIFPELTAEEQAFVVDRIAGFFGSRVARSAKKPSFLESATGKRESIRRKTY